MRTVRSLLKARSAKDSGPHGSHCLSYSCTSARVLSACRGGSCGSAATGGWHRRNVRDWGGHRHENDVGSAWAWGACRTFKI